MWQVIVRELLASALLFVPTGLVVLLANALIGLRDWYDSGQMNTIVIVDLVLFAVLIAVVWGLVARLLRDSMINRRVFVFAYAIIALPLAQLIYESYAVIAEQLVQPVVFLSIWLASNALLVIILTIFMRKLGAKRSNLATIVAVVVAAILLMTTVFIRVY
jgi:hypothetical protein